MEENPVRKRILHFVSQNPGSPLLSVGKSLGINESTLRYHLKCLERKGEVDLKTLEGRRLVYPGSGSVPEVLDRRKGRKLDARSRKILAIIGGSPGLDHEGILEMTDLSKKEVLMVLRGLIRSRRIIMVEDEENERCAHYLTGTYYDNMFRYLVELLLQRKIDEESFLRRKRELDRICGRD
ncbi:MAG: winged helix-turn-helix transcriptional regulator [Thermoplasmatota archaeon]